MKLLKGIALVVLVGCTSTGDPTSPPSDSGAADSDSATTETTPPTDEPTEENTSEDEPSVPDEPIVITPPIVDSPALPNLPSCLDGDHPSGCAALPDEPYIEDWECPEGWLPTPAGYGLNFNVCEPDEENFMPACPEGEWPVDIPEGNVIYVDDDAPIPSIEEFSGFGYGFDPTTALREIAIAHQVAPYYLDQGFPIEAIVVAKGTYTGFQDTLGIPILGACAAETIVANDQQVTDFTLFQQTDGSFVQNMTFVGEGNAVDDNNGIMVSDAQVTLKNVILEGIPIYTNTFVQTQQDSR